MKIKNAEAKLFIAIITIKFVHFFTFVLYGYTKNLNYTDLTKFL